MMTRNKEAKKKEANLYILFDHFIMSSASYAVRVEGCIRSRTME